MKTQSIILTIAFTIVSFFATAQAKPTSEKIKVWGNCGMCKKHIEKAAKEAGASTALWSEKTKMLSVKYDLTKTSNKQIQEAVAAAGYDTRDYTGKDLAYEKLDECCKYDRKASETKEKTKH